MPEEKEKSIQVDHHVRLHILSDGTYIVRLKFPGDDEITTEYLTTRSQVMHFIGSLV